MTSTACLGRGKPLPVFTFKKRQHRGLQGLFTAAEIIQFRIIEIACKRTTGNYLCRGYNILKK
jgi:hypothetical protein